MILKNFKRPSSLTEGQNTLAQAVEEYTQQLSKNPLLAGQLIEDIRINTSVELAHSLGRPYMGYLVVNKTSNSNVWTTNKLNKDIVIRLTSSADVTVDIWIF